MLAETEGAEKVQRQWHQSKEVAWRKKKQETKLCLGKAKSLVWLKYILYTEKGEKTTLQELTQGWERSILGCEIPWAWSGESVESPNCPQALSDFYFLLAESL